MRRVVTGVGADGAAGFVSDGTPACVLSTDNLPGMEVVYVWSTDAPPLVPNAGEDTTRVDQEFFPQREGSRFLVITYPPGFGVGPPEPEEKTAGMSAPASLERLLMHATTTVDYAIMLHGEMKLILDSGDEVTLRPTDTVVQNGTVHGWRNASDEIAVIAFVILGARTGSSRGEMESATL